MMNAVYADIPRIYTAVAEWCACMMFIVLLKRKVEGARLAGVCAGFLVLQSVFLILTGNVPTVLWIPCMALAVLFMYLMLRVCCKTTPIMAGHCCAMAFMVAELAASLEWQLHCYLLPHAAGMKWIGVILPLVVYSVVFGTVYQFEKAIMKGHNYDLSGRELISAILIAALTFAISNLSFVSTNIPFTSTLIPDIFNIRTLVDLGGVTILIAYQSRISELNTKNELLSIQSVLKSQYEQYRRYQESIDMINMKYHDLKHQIEGFRAESDPEKRKEWLNALDRELELYEITNKTGNDVLDTVLNGKILYCKKHDIKITCVVDGTLLDFMPVTDICTIFGNALDNAIESVILVSDAEKRLIHLSVSAQKDFLFIQVENYCENEIQMQDGIPVTTKNDRGNHGFGLKSIRYTIEKYDGNLSVNKNKNWFELKILIPLSKQ